ncbi:MAG TPA: M48 family peptidase [Gammaproteobacteria bacterium]|nr:M48 family peptidase [Gammaproteobacteria bacterium]
MPKASFIGLMLGLLAACATSPTGRAQLTLIPDAQINAMGTASFDQIQQQTPKETDPAVVGYVQCVARAITEVVGGEWDVVVFKDPAVNAFALPGSHIGVYTGLLGVAQTQDQLAAVLGHEVGHVLARHGNERVSQQVATEQVLGFIAASTGVQGRDPRLLGLLGLGAQVGVLLPFSRLQESEADRIGLKLMAKAGFDPAQAVALWRNMAENGGAGPPQFLSTHPSHDTRIKDLQKWQGEARPHFEAARKAGKQPRCQ